MTDENPYHSPETTGTYRNRAPAPSLLRIVIAFSWGSFLIVFGMLLIFQGSRWWMGMLHPVVLAVLGVLMSCWGSLHLWKGIRGLRRQLRR